MDTVLFLFAYNDIGLTLLVLYFRVEEKIAGGKFHVSNISREESFAGGKFREIPCAVDIYFAGGKFRAKSKFANIAKISSTRKIRVIQYLPVVHPRLV